MNKVNLTNTFMGTTNNLADFVSNSNTLSGSSASGTFNQKLSKAKEEVSRIDSKESQPTKNYASETKKEPVSNNQVTQKDTRQDIPKDEKVKELESTVVDEKEPDEKKVIDNEILLVVSQVLQMPIEAIQEKLATIGLEAQDLLTEEGFAQFVNEIFTTNDMSLLLSGEVDIQKISKLFEQLSEVKEKFGQVLEMNENNSIAAPIETHQDEAFALGHYSCSSCCGAVG